MPAWLFPSWARWVSRRAGRSCPGAPLCLCILLPTGTVRRAEERRPRLCSRSLMNGGQGVSFVWSAGPLVLQGWVEHGIFQHESLLLLGYCSDP